MPKFTTPDAPIGASGRPQNANFNTDINNGIQIGFMQQVSKEASRAESAKTFALSRYRRYKTRLRGTCDWVVQKREYKEWISAGYEASMLQIQGQMGCGKSTLVARMIEEVERTDDVKLLYFFIDEKADQASLEQVLLAFWGQLHNKPTDDEDDDGIDSDIASIDDLKEKLLEKLRETWEHRLCIVIDGFNGIRLPEQRELLDDFARKCHGIVRVSILASYRTGSDPEKTTWMANHEICVEKTSTEADVRNYLVQSLTEKLPKDITGNRTDYVNEVAEIIWERTNGMFLQAKVSVDKVSEARNQKEAELCLGQTTIQEDYNDIVSRWENGTVREKWQCVLARQVTALLTHPTGLLSAAALAEVAAIDVTSKKIKNEVYDFVKEDPMAVVRYCSPFVEYDQQLHVFRFYHSSIHDYFLRHAASVARFANLTLAYLCQSEFERGPEKNAFWHDPRGLRDFLAKHPYLEFASSHWVASVKASNKKRVQSEEPTDQLLVDLYNSPQNLLLVFQVFCFNARVSMPTEVRAAHIFSYFGLIDRWPSDRHRLGLGAMQAVDSDGRTALHWAMCGKDTESIVATARVLIDIYTEATALRAAVTAQDVDGLTPLHYAAQSGDIGAIELLLDCDSKDLDTRSWNNGTALRVAAREGHDRVVEKLLDEGADVNIKSKLGTALHAAVASGSEKSVKMIVSAPKLRRNASGDAYGTPLHTAAYHGNEAIVNNLLKKGFDARNKSWQYGSTITAAAAGCYEGKDPAPFQAIMEQLRKRGARVDAPGQTRETALHYAARFGQAEIVRFLLEHNANVKAEGPAGTPFDVADEKGNTAAIGVFREYHGDVRSKHERAGGDGHHSSRVATAIWIPVWRIALANNDMTRMYNLIETYEQVCQRAILNERQIFIQRLAPLGIIVFSLVVELATRRQRQQEQQVGRQAKLREARKKRKSLEAQASSAMQRLKVGVAGRIEEVLCYFGFKMGKSEQSALQINPASTVGSDNQMGDLSKVLNRITEAAVCVLGAAFTRRNAKAIDTFANAWVTALQTVAVRDVVQGPAMLKTLVEERAKQLKALLRDEKVNEACILANVGIELLTIALSRGPAYAKLSSAFAELWASALCDAGDLASGGVRMEDVDHVLQTFVSMFDAALNPPDRNRVEALTTSGIEIVVEVVNTGDDGLIKRIEEMLNEIRRNANDKGMDQVVEGALSRRRAAYAGSAMEGESPDERKKARIRQILT